MILPELLKTLLSQAIQVLPALLSFIAIYFSFWLLAKLTASCINKVAKKSAPQKQPICALFAIIVKGAILLIGLITALGSVGMNVNALVASLGLSSFALSFATKDIFSNFCAGILILFYQPFKIGQSIQIGATKGTITYISLRYTHLKDENKEILIPNSSLLTQSITINH